MIELDALIRILDDNKVNYARKFKDIEVNGYDSNQCQRLSFEIREDIERLLRIGFAGGMDVTLKNSIYELTEIAVKLSGYKAALKLDDYIEKKKEILHKYRNYKGDKNMPDIKKEVIAYIDDSLAGVNAMIIEEKSEYKKSILNASKDLLSQLKDKVNNVFDNVSVDAADCAANLLGDSKYGLFAWRDYVGRNMVFDTVNTHLEEAISEADKWAELTKAVNKRNYAKDKDIVKYTEDVFSGYSRVAAVKEKGDAFFSRLKDFEEQFDVQNESYDKVKQINDDIAQMQKEISEIIDKMDNGEILEEEADSQITMLEQDIEIREMEREQYRSSIRMMNNNLLAMRRLLSKFKRLELIYRMYQQIEPNLFYTMFEYIDFRQFLDILSYGASEEDITMAISYYDNIMENVAMQTRHMAETDERFANVNKVMEKEQSVVHRQENKVDREKEKQELKARMEARRKRYAGKTAQPASEPESKQEKEERQDNGEVQITDIV